jgi:undecaprenyl-diphosphatase
MLDWLNQIDTTLFIFFNVSLANPVFDFIMPVLTCDQTWYPLWVILFIGLLWKGGSRGRWFVLLAILAVTTADQSVNQFLKPLFGRIRPCNVIDIARELVPCSSSFSMPSSHAANFFTTAAMGAFFYPRYQVWYWLIAVMVSYSRIAVGRHYPFDALIGAIIGSSIALLWMYFFLLFLKRIGKKFPE